MIKIQQAVLPPTAASPNSRHASPRGEYELTDAIRALTQSGKKVQALELTGEWADLRDPETLARLNKL